MNNQKDEKGVGTYTGATRIWRPLETKMKNSKGNLKKEIIDISDDG